MNSDAEPRDRGAPLASGDLESVGPLAELLAGAEPLDSIDDLLIADLTDDEERAFLAAIGVSLPDDEVDRASG